MVAYFLSGVTEKRESDLSFLVSRHQSSAQCLNLGMFRLCSDSTEWVTATHSDSGYSGLSC